MLVTLECPDQEEDMPDVTLKEMDEMDGIYNGLARRARAELGVTHGRYAQEAST
jgi:hypothetical protein